MIGEYASDATISQGLEVISRWKPYGLEKALEGYYIGRRGTKCSVQGLMVDLSNNGIEDLAGELQSTVGDHGLISVMSFILENDPSPEPRCQRKADIAKMIAVEPFPSYYVGIAYLLCLGPISSPKVIDPLLTNMIQKKHIYWPELLYDLLAKFKTREELVSLSVAWLKSIDGDLRMMGDGLAYCLNPSSDNEREQLIDAYYRAEELESDPLIKQQMAKKTDMLRQSGSPFWVKIEQ